MEQTRSQIYKSIPIPGVSNFLAFLSDGEVTRDLIQATLNKKCLGKKYDAYCTPGSVGNTVVSLLMYSKKWSHLYANYDLTYSSDGNECVVKWRGLPLGKLVVHKKKAGHNYSRYGNWCDWVVSSIDVYGFDDLNRRVAEIITIEARNKALADQQLKEACDIVRAVRAMFPGLDDYRIRAKIEWLHKNQYKVWDALKDEGANG